MKFKSIAATLILVSSANILFSQNVIKDIIKGNEAYKKKQYDQAADAYQKVIKVSSKNTTAYYNLGNALYKNDKLDDALQAYDNSAGSSVSNTSREKAYYNGGVVLQKQNKLPECIKAYKNALKLAPNDEDARQNLERALMQQKQQQKKDQKNKDQDKKDQDKNQQKPNDQQKNDPPKPQPSKISKQDAEEKLKSLLEHEKDLQDKLHKVKTNSPDQPKKDW